MSEKTFVVLRDRNRRARNTGGFRTRSLESVFGDELADLSVKVESMTEDQADDAARDDETVGIAQSMPISLIRPFEVAEADTAVPTADWGIKAVKADQSQFTGSGVTVAVLDTGIDAAHPAFAGVQLVQRDFTGEGEHDDDGHGTHCAGTIFGRDVDNTRIGVARGVNKALIGKVLGAQGGSTDMIFQAIEWAHQGGADVISMSLGFDFPGMVARLTDNGMPVQRATSEALRVYRDNLRLFDSMMHTHNVSIGGRRPAVVVAASGNESERTGNPPYVIGKSLPSDAVEIISVGAAGPANGSGHTIAPFSNVDVEVVAPGVGILSAQTGGGLKRLSGTSMATPHVAGIVALWFQSIAQNGAPRNAMVVKSNLLASARANVFGNSVSLRDRGSGMVTAP